MGWNKQSGESWELQRTAVFAESTVNGPEKGLALKVTGLLTIEDAHKLALAILEEVSAAAKSEGTRLFLRDQLGIEVQPWQQRIMEQVEQRPDETREQWKARTFSLHYGAEQDFTKAVLKAQEEMFGEAVLKNWDEVLGEYKGEYDYAPQFDEDDGCPND